MTRYIIGVDEVGRGPLAGPVTVAAVIVPRHMRFRRTNLGELKDSKQLTQRQREAWFNYIETHSDITYAISRVTPRVIDRINISRASNLAATRSVARLVEEHKINISWCTVLLDGLLYLKMDDVAYRTVVRGDEKFNAIKLASIVAKVNRDEEMKRLHKRFHQYGFAKHKGYGTEEHRAMIRKHGLCDAHRLSFIGFLKDS